MMKIVKEQQLYESTQTSATEQKYINEGKQ